MIMNLPKLKDTKSKVINLECQLIEERAAGGDSDMLTALSDDLRYQKNVYTNLFNKFWRQKTSLQEERAHIQLKEQESSKNKKHNTNESKLSHLKKLRDTNDGIASRMSSRRESIGEESDELRNISEVFNNPDERPIKPMTEQSLNHQIMESKSIPNSMTNLKDEKNEKKKTKEINEKTKKQQELLARRKKYDPRTAIINKSQANDLKNMSPNHSNDTPPKDEKGRRRKKESLENILETYSEDKSIHNIGEDDDTILDSKKKFEFLKRRSRKVQLNKVDWSHVQRRIDWWVPKENIIEKKDLNFHKKAGQGSSNARSKALGNSPDRSPKQKDLDLIKLKSGGGDSTPKKSVAGAKNLGKLRQQKKKNVEKSEKSMNLTKTIEETCQNSYLPRLKEVMDMQINIDDTVDIPYLKTDSEFMLYIEENELKDVLEELEEEYDILANL